MFIMMTDICLISGNLWKNIFQAEPETTGSYSGQFKLRIPKTLHKTSNGILRQKRA